MSWTLIEHQALTSSVASVTLGSGGTIPQTYKTLKLVISARSSAGTYYDGLKIVPNAFASGFTTRTLQGSGSGTNSYPDTNNWWRTDIVGNTATASTFDNTILEMPNYASSANKVASADSVTENNATNALQELHAMLVTNTAAITSLTLTAQNGNLVSGSTFTLYGLA